MFSRAQSSSSEISVRIAAAKIFAARRNPAATSDLQRTAHPQRRQESLAHLAAFRRIGWKALLALDVGALQEGDRDGVLAGRRVEADVAQPRVDLVHRFSCRLVDALLVAFAAYLVR